MSKTDKMKTPNDFPQAFIERVRSISANYDEVRLVFDKYIYSSLKDKHEKSEREIVPSRSNGGQRCRIGR